MAALALLLFQLGRIALLFRVQGSDPGTSLDGKEELLAGHEASKL